MPTQALSEAMELAASWPAEIQDELAAIAREMDAEFRGGTYHASAEELAGIDRGLAAAREGRFATAEEMEELFAKYRPR